MQFASLLPSLRDLRAPLAGGALWMLLAWFLLTAAVEDLPSLLTVWPISAVSVIVEEAGPISLTIIVAFVAYLLGIVLVNPINDAIDKLLRSIVAKRADQQAQWLGPPRRKRYSRRSFEWLAGLGSVDRVAAKATRLSSDFVGRKFRSSSMIERETYLSRASMALQISDRRVTTSLVAATLTARILVDMNYITDRLLVERPLLYDKVDRVKSEAEFRFAVGAPALTTVISIAWMLNLQMALVGVVPIALILRSSLRLLVSFYDAVLDSWASGNITPPIVTQVEEELGTAT